MGWIRPRVRFAALLALAALALNFGFAFSHHHFDDLRGVAAGDHSGVFGHTDDGEDDHHGSTAAHPCFICIIVSAASVAASPPALPAQTSMHTADTATAKALDLRRSERTSFEARAPPRA
jgi:hypothetical protein